MTKSTVTSQQENDSFLVSVYVERWTVEDQEIGETDDDHDFSVAEINRETWDAEELALKARDFGIDEPSASSPDMNGGHIWFRSSTPPMDNEFIHEGIKKYYTLFIHEANGHKPTEDDIRRVAEIVNIKFSDDKKAGFSPV